MGGSGSNQTKYTKNSGKAVDIVITPEPAEVIARARGLKIKYGLISPSVLPPQKGGAYTIACPGDDPAAFEQNLRQFMPSWMAYDM
ncbi:hypothetical protein [Janthinobacterium lividum]|uniref:hypothetical protein n=1 Tax=Janthinobacterium lividum TaxID=29581 RepID=UPI001F0F1911|nr:hypothetical protein [Janthinobacterium lividum]